MIRTFASQILNRYMRHHGIKFILFIVAFLCMHAFTHVPTLFHNALWTRHQWFRQLAKKNEHFTRRISTGFFSQFILLYLYIEFGTFYELRVRHYYIDYRYTFLIIFSTKKSINLKKLWAANKLQKVKRKRSNAGFDDEICWMIE